MTATFLDTGVLIDAWRGQGARADRARALLDDPGRRFVVSDFVRLELLPGALRSQISGELELYYELFAGCTMVPASPELVEKAIAEATECAELKALDALHIAAARLAQVDEFITTEKPESAMFRVRSLRVTSLVGG